MQVTMTKKGQGKAAGPVKKLKVGDAIPGINLQDNGDQTYSVFGQDAAGAQLDISGIATATAVSSDPSVVTTDSPLTAAAPGLNGANHAATPAPAVGATATVTITVTVTDGSVGPFVIDWPQTITAGPLNKVVVTPGTPTTH